MNFWLFGLMALAALESSLAGGSQTGVAPGTRLISGIISEWPVPTPKYARDPAVGPDGNVYFAVWLGDKIARFDPRTRRFQEWDIPAGAHPRDLVVAHDGKVLFGGSGNNAIGELDPTTGKVKTYKLWAVDSDPYTLAFDAQGTVWFTQRNIGVLAKLDRATGRVTEYPIGEGPYGLSLDKRGNVWVTRNAADVIVKFDPVTERLTSVKFAKGAQPRRTAVAPDGMLWVSLYGVGRVARIDPDTNRVIKEYELPGGPNAGPYAINADASGRVWVAEIQTDNVVLLEPESGKMQVFKLPGRNSGVRRAAIDADGRYWYVGSNVGRLGVIE